MKRTSSHEKETLSRAYVEKILAKWVPNRLNEDYALDYIIHITEDEEVKGLGFFVQLKASDRFNFQNDEIHISLETKYLNHHLQQQYPVLLVVYDVQNEKAYWVIVQEYIWDHLEKITPNWAEQKTVTVKIPRSQALENLSLIESSVKITSEKIAIYQVSGINWVEQLRQLPLDEELIHKMEGSIGKSFTDMKLSVADKFSRYGRSDTAEKKLLELYHSPDKETKLKAILLLASMKNMAVEKENKAAVELSEEGIKLARELGNKRLEAILRTQENQAVHHILTKRINEVLYSKMVIQTGGVEWLLFFSDDRLIKFMETIKKLSEENIEILEDLIEEKDFNGLVYALTINLEMITLSILRSHLFAKESLGEQIRKTDPLSNFLLKMCEKLTDETMKMRIHDAIGSFYYFTLRPNEAKKNLEKALEYGKRNDDPAEVGKIESLLSMIRETPNPYNPPKPKKDFKQLTLKEIQELTIGSLQLQGINLEQGEGDHFLDAIHLGVKDLDQEEYFRFCENLFIEQVSTSPVGRATALPTLGPKLVFCEYGKNIHESVNLELIINALKNESCKDCKHRKPRPPDWKCTVGWLENRKRPEKLEALLKKIRTHGV